MSDTQETTIAETEGEKLGAGEAAEGAAAPRVEAAVAAAPVPSVGRSLRTAREAAHMSVAEVAQILKFSTRQIEALEADEFSTLPGTTIVRGFVRSYAKLLKLDGNMLLQMLDANTPSAPADVRPPENMGVANQPGVERQFSPLLSIAIVLALAALLLALWHFFGPGTSKSSTTAIGQAAQGTTTAVPAAAAPVESVAVPAAPPAVATAPATPAATPAANVPVASAPPAAAEPAQPAAATASGPALVFSFRDRCWVEVTDATKQRLHSGENPAGSRLTLAGKPPYEVVIGNAAKASLTYGDRTIDLAPYTRAEVARLTLE